MRLSFLLATGLLPLSALAGEIPVVEGVLGGVPIASRARSTFKGAPFKTTASTPGKLRIKENIGICETTRGVYQAAGYGDISETKSIWFWFFAARKNPDTAPVAIWFNGGPGSSSMNGLFQEHGPCRINNETTTVSHNPYSWNNDVNMIYIDQPAGVGFSHGDLNIGSSEDAAVDVWKFLQIFFQDSRFAKYQPRNLAIWTESYGGHYGPIFANYILKQNAAIAAKTATGVTLNLNVLGIGNGITDPLVQYQYYLAYAAYNPYQASGLVSSSIISQANSQYNSCKDKIAACYNGGSNAICSDAQQFCNKNVLTPLSGNYDPYYVASKLPNPYPANITNYLSSIRSAIGAETVWQGSNPDVYARFAETGDWMRNARPALEAVIKAGVRTLLYNGDADFTSNFWGFEYMILALETQYTAAYKEENWKPYTVAGQVSGNYKTTGKLSYVRFGGAGLAVPAYRSGNLDYGQAAAQMFTQTMQDQSISAA
ncbi:serine carboxypeptidase [Panaeolus papilionaceus]|nr:serine carboxypeptidase [Panaeolus papilionaceus]